MSVSQMSVKFYAVSRTMRPYSLAEEERYLLATTAVNLFAQEATSHSGQGQPLLTTYHDSLGRTGALDVVYPHQKHSEYLSADAST